MNPPAPLSASMTIGAGRPKVKTGSYVPCPSSNRACPLFDPRRRRIELPRQRARGDAPRPDRSGRHRTARSCQIRSLATGTGATRSGQAREHGEALQFDGIEDRCISTREIVTGEAGLPCSKGFSSPKGRSLLSRESRRSRRRPERAIHSAVEKAGACGKTLRLKAAAKCCPKTDVFDMLFLLRVF